MEGIILAMLVDRGLIDYEDRISTHWPEFGDNGKGEIKLKDLMRHEAGLAFFPDPDHPTDPKFDMIPSLVDLATLDGLEEMIQASGTWKYGVRMYHATTRGFILQGLVRRLTGSSIGEFMKTEICLPLELTFECGTTLKEQEEYHYVGTKTAEKWYGLIDVFRAGAGMGGNEIMYNILRNMSTNEEHPLHRYRDVKEWGQKGAHYHLSTPQGRTFEYPSAGMQANARSMAKINALMANKGSFGGTRLLSEEAVLASMQGGESAVDETYGLECAFTQGGFADFGSMREACGVNLDEAVAKPRRGFIGSAGKGGSLSMWDPSRRLAVAYVPTGLHNTFVHGERDMAIVAALHACVTV